MSYALTTDDLLRMYRRTQHPAGLDLWTITTNELLAAAVAANLATVGLSTTWPRTSLPEPAQTEMTDDQLLFVLNTIETERGSGRVWTEEDIP